MKIDAEQKEVFIVTATTYVKNMGGIMGPCYTPVGLPEAVEVYDDELQAYKRAKELEKSGNNNLFGYTFKRYDVDYCMVLITQESETYKDQHEVYVWCGNNGFASVHNIKGYIDFKRNLVYKDLETLRVRDEKEEYKNEQ